MSARYRLVAALALAVGVFGIAGCASPAASSSGGSAAVTTSSEPIYSSPVPSVPENPDFGGIPDSSTEAAPPTEPSWAEKAEAAMNKAGVSINGYDNPATYVEENCQFMRTHPGGVDEFGLETSPSSFLLNQVSGNGEAAFRAMEIGIPMLCPRFKAEIAAVANGTADVQNGNYTVGNEMGNMSPGTWQATGPASNCYWERTSPSGEIIDNNFATHATALTVNVASTDGSVSFQECPIMEFVG